METQFLVFILGITVGAILTANFNVLLDTLGNMKQFWKQFWKKMRISAAMTEETPEKETPEKERKWGWGDVIVCGVLAVPLYFLVAAVVTGPPPKAEVKVPRLTKEERSEKLLQSQAEYRKEQAEKEAKKEEQIIRDAVAIEFVTIAFQKNAIAARKKYKEVVLLGVVNGIDTTLFGQPYVSLTSFTTGYRDQFPQPTCYFGLIGSPPTEIDKLSVGDVVVISGKFDSSNSLVLKFTGCKFHYTGTSPPSEWKPKPQ